MDLTDSDKMMELVKKHKLGFVFNPGGGEFNRHDSNYGRCQITMMDDTDDYQTLLLWLKKIGKEQWWPVST